jgi:hypothetical protein
MYKDNTHRNQSNGNLVLGIALVHVGQLHDAVIGELIIKTFRSD